MKNTILILCFCSTTLFAQVGIGTTSPNASLEIISSSQAAPANNDGILIPKVDEFPASSPTAAQDGMLVYVTGNGSVNQGFYFWNQAGSVWDLVNGGDDIDWYEEGTTQSPNAITDNKYTMGRMAIGKNTTGSKTLEIQGTVHGGLDIEVPTLIGYDVYGLDVDISGDNDRFKTAGYFRVSGSGSLSHYGLQTRLTGNASGNLYGLNNEIFGSGDGDHFGMYSDLRGNGSGAHYGSYNLLSGTGTGTHAGTYNDLQSTGGGILNGTVNEVTGGSTSTHRGVLNILSGSGSGDHVGSASLLSGSGTGAQYGALNFILNNEDGDHYGTFSQLGSNGDGDQYGSYQRITNSGDGLQYASYRELSGNGNGDHFGDYSEISGSGGGNQFGSRIIVSNSSNSVHMGQYTTMEGSGNGGHYGLYNVLNGSGSGTETGVRNQINGDGSGNKTGVYNLIGLDGSGNQYGIQNHLEGISNGLQVAAYNNVINTGSGDKYASRNRINSPGNGTFYATHNEVLGSGSGVHYGSYNYLWASTGSGSHVAGYFDAPGGTNDYAAVFNEGNVVVNESGGNYDLRVEADSQSHMFFVDASTNRIGIRENSPAFDIHLKQSSNTQAGAGGIAVESSSASNDWKIYHSGSHFSFAENGTRRGYIQAGTGSYIVTSDKNLKKNIQPMDGVLEKVLQMNTYSYLYKDQEAVQPKTLGFMAQEIQPIFPELVVRNEDGDLGINYAGFSVLAIKAIQEQQQQIELLKKELDEVKTLIKQN